MMSEKHKFIFIHIPRTGGNSVQNILREYSEDDIITKHAHQDGADRFALRNKKFRRLIKHSTINDYYKALGSDYRKYYLFTTIRNPFDKLVSFYFSPQRGGVQWDADDFSKFVRRCKPMEYFTSLRTGFMRSKKNIASSFNKIMRFEQLSDDFSDVMIELGLPKCNLPHRNKSSNQIPYQDFYDEKLRRFVEEKHKYEIELGGYEFSAKKMFNPTLRACTRTTTEARQVGTRSALQDIT